MKRKLFNFFVIGAFFAIIFTACGHKPSLDGLENMIIPKPVKVTWSVDGGGAENLKSSVERFSNNEWVEISQGDEVYTGSELFMFARNDSTIWYALDRDKTKINGKTVAELGKDIANFTSNGKIKYTIPQDAKAVHIEFVLKKAEKLHVEWKSKNPEDGEVKRWLKNDSADNPIYDTASEGDFFEGTSRVFHAFPKEGKVIKNWYINNKPQNNTNTGFRYNFQKADLIDGKILIEAEFGDKETDIPVYWKSLDETKGTIYAGRQINGNWTTFTSGNKFEEGYFFYVNARPNPGFIADKWYINGEEVPGTGINHLRYTVASKDIKNGKIEISVSFKEAPKIKVEWFIDEPDKGSIRAEQVINGKWTEVQSGSLFDQSSKICIVVEPKEGYAPDTWYINGKEANTWTKGEPECWYTVDINDIANGSIKISHKFKIAEKIQMDFIKEGNGKMSVHNPKTNALITDTQIYEGTQLRIKASPFLGSKFKNFELNGNEITEGIWQWNGDSGIYVFDYTVKAEDKNSDTISIKAVFEEDTSATQGTIPVEFAVESGHEDKGSIIAVFNDEKEFESGYKFNKDDWFNFYALPKDGYQAKWFVNGTEYHTGNNCYIELYTENIVDGKLSVKAQFVPANPVRLNFSSEGNGNIRAEKLMGGDWITVNSGDTVYEGTDIYFAIEDAEGNIADWFINGKEIDEIGWKGSIYFNITDHNKDGSCIVKASFREAETYPVSFKIAEGGEGKGSLSIEYWDIVKREWKTVTEQNISIKEGSSGLRFMVSLNGGAQVEKWTINGEAQQHNPKTFWFGALHKSKLGGQNKLEVVVHLK